MATADRQVVRLGPPTGEDDVASCKARGLPNDGSGVVERLAGPPSASMGGCGVGVTLGEPRHHRF